MNSDIKSILYASDLGEGSRSVFRHAVRMGQKYDAKITYLHVIEAIPESSKVLVQGYIGKGEYVQNEKEAYREIVGAVTQRVKEFCEDEMKEDIGKLNIDIVIKTGRSWRCILDSADEVDADLIVIGARKHNAMEKLFLGSTSNKVAQHSTRPLLIVPLTD